MWARRRLGAALLPSVVVLVALAVPAGAVAASADISTGLVADKDGVAPDTDLTYTVSVHTDATTTHAATDFILPSGTSFTSLIFGPGTPAGTTCSLPASGGGGTIHCTVPSLAAGQTQIYTVLTHVLSTTTGVMHASATTTSPDTSDPNPSNDMATLDTPVGSTAEMAAGLTAPETVLAGSQITYTATLLNRGALTADHPVLVLGLPGGTTFVSLVQTSGPSVDCTTPLPGAGGTVRCSRDSLIHDQPVVLKVTVNTSPSANGTVTATDVAFSRTPESANDNDSASATTTVTQPPPPPVKPPVLTALKLTPQAFHAARTGPSIATAKTGTTISYNVSEAGTTTFKVDQALPGVKLGGNCVKRSRRTPHGKPCTRFVPKRGTFPHTDTAGLNSFHFTGRIGGKTLKPGNYRVDATPQAGGQIGQVTRTPFQIIR